MYEKVYNCKYGGWILGETAAGGGYFAVDDPRKLNEICKLLNAAQKPVEHMATADGKAILEMPKNCIECPVYEHCPDLNYCSVYCHARLWRHFCSYMENNDRKN